jgi:hypothetical protein
MRAAWTDVEMKIDFAALALASVMGSVMPALAQDDNVQPSPPSIGADVPLTYFGPAPSQVQRELIGPYQLLKSGTVDIDAGTIELPLYRGTMTDGRVVWYVVTDTDDEANAAGLGINFSSKPTYADVGAAMRSATLGPDLELVFAEGTVDFAPERAVTPSEASAFFPPSDAAPGSVGDAAYSQLMRIENAGGHIYNAPVVAFDVEAEALDATCDGDPNHAVVHDKVVSICPRDGTVTMQLTSGFSFARPVLYLSTEASDPLVATLEGATLTPGLGDVAVGGDDSLFSAVERIFVFANGPTGPDNPQRQGLDSALSDGRGPLNVLGGIPTVATDYSPLWDLNPAVWTQEAIDAGYRARMTEEFAILGLAERGFITGLGGAPFGSAGIVVNCPMVWRFL